MSVQLISSRDKDALNLYGGNLEAFKSREKIVILVGPAGTGKTFAMCLKMHLFCVKYPGVKVLLCRKNLPSLRKTVVKTYQKILKDFGYIDKVRTLGESRPERFIYDEDQKEWDGKVYKGKSEIYLSQIDSRGTALGAEYDMIYVNQPDTEGLTEDDFLLVASRARLPYAPYRQIIADPNPAHDQHWLLKGSKPDPLTGEPKWKLYESTHKDNPEYYNPETDEWTLVGKEHLRQLALLPPHLKDSQLYGKWYNTSGMVFGEVWDPAIHILHLGSQDALDLGVSLIDETDGEFYNAVPQHWEHYLSIDWGGTDPFVALLIAKHPERDLFILHKHIYTSNRNIDEQSFMTKQMIAGYNIRAIIADRAKAETFTMEKYLDIPITTAKKGNNSNNDSMNICLSQLMNNKWKFVITEESLFHTPDEKLIKAMLPMGCEELPNLKKDDKTGGIAPKQADHFYDAWKYFCRWWTETTGGSRRKETVLWL